MLKSINELYEKTKSIWKQENEFYFGITPLSQWNDKKVADAHLLGCAKRFWNQGTNELKELFLHGKCRDMDKMVPESFRLEFDKLNGCICLFAQFYKEITNEDGKLEKIVKESPLAYLPYPNDLCWFIGDSEYVLRITASVNYGLISRTGDICEHRLWKYNIADGTFTAKEDVEPYDTLNYDNIQMLESCYGHPIQKENWEEALKTLPEYNYKSILKFKFRHVDEIFNMVKISKRFANPLSRVPIPINVNKMITAKRRNNSENNDSFNNLVLSNNKLFALENTRTVIYKSEFNTGFNFDDSNKLFDAFKTSTNKSAGRSRLILDTTFVRDGLLWNVVDGKEWNMFQLVKHDDLMVDENLSILSCSMFSSNNDPKRIMMTAKLRAQAIPTKGEVDSFTHETPARIVFGDFEGFNYGDSIIISRSFARKLESHYERSIKFGNFEEYKRIADKYQIGDYMTSQDFNSVVGSNMCANYRKIKIVSMDQNTLEVEAIAPFSVGDKITNLHGSKGIACIILEDDQMPYLKNDINEHFKAGPLEVIVSALSVYRRKALGQIFEAWALASGYYHLRNIQEAIKDHKHEMKEFSEKSIIVWHGKETIKPCGINMFLRLDHNAVTKQSRSFIRTNSSKMLKFGEMELLNLAARDLKAITNELDIRSVGKHLNALKEIREMQEFGALSKEPANNLKFFHIMKTLGFRFNLTDGVKPAIPEMYKLQNLITDDPVNLFGDD